MQAREKELCTQLLAAEAQSADVAKQFAALKVRHSLLENEFDGAISIARTLTKQLAANNIPPAQDIEAYLRYQKIMENERAIE